MDAARDKSDLRKAAVAAEAARLAGTGRSGWNAAAALLLTEFGGPMRGYFMRNRAPEAVAEELASDVVCRFVMKPLPDTCPPVIWLWTIARNALIDWARALDTERRGGAGQTGRIEVALDEDAMLGLLDTHLGHSDIPGWVRDCVHKAAALMQQEDPRQAEVLWMEAQEWSAEEVAIYYGATPGKVSLKQKAAARDRLYRARNAARGYFEHCKE